MQIIIRGRIPSKKNSVVMFVRNGKLFKMPSNKYREWHKDASEQLKGQYPLAVALSGIPIVKVQAIELRLFAPDKRAADLTNKAESVMDLLVDNGIIADDNWFVVPIILLTFGGVDKADPRVEIILK